MKYFLLLISVFLACPALGQWGAGGHRSERDGTPTHAWIVFPERTGPGATVLHIPPRSGGLAGEGVIRVAGELGRTPMLAAAEGARTLFVFDSPETAFDSKVGPPPRQVFSTSAVYATKGRWASSPEGRMEAMPPLPSHENLLGVAGCDGTFLAVVERAGTATLLRLESGAWVEVPGSPLAEVRGIAAVIDMPRGIGVLSRDGSRLVRVEVAGERATISSSPFPEEVLEGIADRTLRATVVGEDLVVASGPVNGAVELTASMLPREAGGLLGAWRQLGRVENVGPSCVLVPLESDQRVVLAWLDEETGAVDRRGSRRVILHEVSVGTGTVMYSGQAKLAGPIVASDLLVVAMVLVTVTGVVGLMLIPVRQEAVELPKGVSLAEPPRRAIAGVVDLFTALVITGAVRGLPVLETLSPASWSTPDGLISLGMALGGLIVVNGVLEGTIGRSLGKFLTGCAVVSVRPGSAGRLSLGRSMLRNLIKWGIPPIGLSVLFDSSGRHKADLLTQTAVTVTIDDEEGEE